MELKDPDEPSDYTSPQHRGALTYMTSISAFMMMFVVLLAADGEFSLILTLVTAGCVGNVIYGYSTLRRRRP